MITTLSESNSHAHSIVTTIVRALCHATTMDMPTTSQKYPASLPSPLNLASLTLPSGASLHLVFYARQHLALHAQLPTPLHWKSTESIVPKLLL